MPQTSLEDRVIVHRVRPIERARARKLKKRAVIYARVSTRDRQNPTNQIDPLEEWCKEKGYTLVTTYTDHDSGSKKDRPAFVQMFNDAAARKFDIVLCWSLDRFTREGIGATFRHLERLNESGVGFYSYTEEYMRSTGPVGPLFIAVAAWIAEFERRRRAERVAAGMVQARKNGVHIGRKGTAFTPEQIAEMNRMNKAGVSLRAIAWKFLTSKSTVKRRLEN